MVRRRDGYKSGCAYANKHHVIAGGLDEVSKDLLCKWQNVKARLNVASEV